MNAIPSSSVIAAGRVSHVVEPIIIRTIINIKLKKKENTSLSYSDNSPLFDLDEILTSKFLEFPENPANIVQA